MAAFKARPLKCLIWFTLLKLISLMLWIRAERISYPLPSFFSSFSFLLSFVSTIKILAGSLSGLFVLILKKLPHSITLPPKFSHPTYGERVVFRGGCSWYVCDFQWAWCYHRVTAASASKLGVNDQVWRSGFNSLWVTSLFIIPNKSEVSNMQVPNGNGVSACQFPWLCSSSVRGKVRSGTCQCRTLEIPGSITCCLCLPGSPR